MNEVVAAAEAKATVPRERKEAPSGADKNATVSRSGDLPPLRANDAGGKQGAPGTGTAKTGTDAEAFVVASPDGDTRTADAAKDAKAAGEAAGAGAGVKLPAGSPAGAGTGARKGADTKSAKDAKAGDGAKADAPKAEGTETGDAKAAEGTKSGAPKGSAPKGSAPKVGDGAKGAESVKAGVEGDTAETAETAVSAASLRRSAGVEPKVHASSDPETDREPDEIVVFAEEDGAHDVEDAQDAEDAEDARDTQDAEDFQDTEDEDGQEPGEADEAEKAENGRMRELPLPEAVSEALANALAILRDSVTGLHFGLDLPGAEEARRAQSELLAQLDDYVIPRVHMSTAPALVVIAGSTGAGKSTLLNTLANAKVSATGVRRPTTGTPVLACHPDDHEWFAEGELLGSLRRRDAPAPQGEPGSLVLVSTERLPTGVALLDTPDIDSVVEEHHEIAHRMLDAADLWIFVTTAARYADAPAWRLLRLAKERGARLAIVLSRVPPKSREVITKHFVRMLTEYGLGDVERFVIDESKVTDGMLPDHEVTDLRLWLTELSVDDRRRAQAVKATLTGTLDSFRTRIPALARQLEVQVIFRRELREDMDTAYATALSEIEEATRNGSLLHGEVLARWQDFAGSGDLMRTLHLRKPGRFAGKATQQAPERLSALKSALRAGLESVIVSAAQRAAEEVVARWSQRSGAGESLAATEGLGRVSDDLARRTSRVVGGWQDHIIELIRTEGVTKRAVARLVSFDVESLALIFVIGLLGYGSAEAEGTAGTGGLPQRLVHALLGAESLRTIGAKARSDLRARIATLFDDETSRYVQALDGAGIPDESAATRLYQATYNLEVAR
ncbi:dynamin family protein [Streptosporangium sp. NPDC051022]|uniref:dynamin family protein n=1 Tax=Streptosporangium sp. NPDC051022 TaxID=3155752 RepID=UPI003414758C